MLNVCADWAFVICFLWCVTFILPELARHFEAPCSLRLLTASLSLRYTCQRCCLVLICQIPSLLHLHVATLCVNYCRGRHRRSRVRWKTLVMSGCRAGSRLELVWQSATQNRFSLTVCNPKSIQFGSLQPKIDSVWHSATQNRFSLTVCNPKSIQFDSLQPKIDLVWQSARILHQIVLPSAPQVLIVNIVSKAPSPFISNHYGSGPVLFCAHRPPSSFGGALRSTRFLLV